MDNDDIGTKEDLVNYRLQTAEGFVQLAEMYCRKQL